MMLLFYFAFLLLGACTSTHVQPARPSGGATQAEPVSSESIRPGLSAHALALGAWVITHDALHESNVLVVRMPDETALLCSSPFDSETSRAVVLWVRERLSPRRIVAINTHWHMDGTGGNAVYHELGVETYASTHTQALSLERGAAMRREAAEDLASPLAEQVRNTPVVAAMNTFEPAHGLTLSFGTERVEVSYPGAAHSQDNVVVYLPSRAILFGGCMLKVGDSLGYLGDASLATWEPALERVKGLGATVVVPGHGRAGGPEIIDNTLRLVRAARAQP